LSKIFDINHNQVSDVT